VFCRFREQQERLQVNPADGAVGDEQQTTAQEYGNPHNMLPKKIRVYVEALAVRV
jgi:hypothetical protein